MYDLEDTILAVWRSEEDDRTTIKKIASAIEEHVDYSNSNHDDLVDFLPHLKLADISPKKKERQIRDYGSYEKKPSEIMPQINPVTPKPVRKPRNRPDSRTPSKNQHYASFMDSSSILENSYIIGNEISYYGCDSICSVNV